MSDSGSSMNKFTVATSGLKLQSFSEHPPVYLTSVQIFPWSHHVRKSRRDCDTLSLSERCDFNIQSSLQKSDFEHREFSSIRHSSQSACCIRHCRGLRLVRRLDHCHCWPIFDGRRAAHWLRLPCSPKTLPETSLFRFRSRFVLNVLRNRGLSLTQTESVPMLSNLPLREQDQQQSPTMLSTRVDLSLILNSDPAALVGMHFTHRRS
ncbi:hypothetical protein IWX48DRAFT_81754 [Phyllosticta citricarpa]